MSQELSFEEEEIDLRKSLVERAERAIALRNKDREFHGVEREFHYHQSQMIVDYERTKDIKHPRDLGDSRETLLRRFLTGSGYLPRKYSVSDLSVRVASQTGHISNEVDIAIYDSGDLITLMKRQGVYEVYPIESVYGVIQVKSNLTKKELKSGFKNLASFKKLKSSVADSRNNKFALLFAYSSEMKWEDIVKEIQDFSKQNPKSEYPNAIFILDRGYFIFGEEKGNGTISNVDIESLHNVAVFGFPDRQQLNLYEFQSLLLELLHLANVSPTNLGSYFRLPLVTGEVSYEFTLGSFAEIGNCKKHGDFARKISAESLEIILGWCLTSEPINWVKAINIAYNLPEDEEAYKRQPQVVSIYNPDGLDLSDILIYNLQDNSGNVKATLTAYDMITTNNINIIIPYFYSIKECLISGCVKCEKAKTEKPK